MAKDLILIVDDDEINRMILADILSNDYDVIEAANGSETLDILFNQCIIPTAILLDIIMPGIDGFEVLEQIKSHYETDRIPVLFITGADADTNESRGLKSGASDYVPKPFNPDVVKTRLDNHINLTRYQHELESLVEEKTYELTRTYEQTLEVLATVVEYRSLESGVHIKRTSSLSEIVVNKLLSDPKYREYCTRERLSPDKANSIIRATSLHDIGKIGISDTILLKPGRLTDEEFEIMKTHTILGSQIIDNILETLGDNGGYMMYCREICHYHHERWDGKGYPTGLAGFDIPFSARLLSIVDVYDALVNERCYKPAFSHEEAMKIIIEGQGTQFDPVLAGVFEAAGEECAALEVLLKD